MTGSIIAKNLGADFEQELRKIVGRNLNLGADELDNVWSEIASDVRTWFAEVGPRTSLLNQRLFILEKLCEHFPNQRLFSKKDVVDVVLQSSGIASVGEQTPIGKIVGRSISARFGIVFQIRSQDGNLFQHEFFD